MKGTTVTYVDPFGKEHDALVTAENGLHPGFLTLVYVDVNAPEPENVKKLYDIAHISDPSKEETNPDLPTYHVNAWKERYEQHRMLPEDHPAFDHPFHAVERDQEGIPIPVHRPDYMSDVDAHLASGTPSAEDLDAVAAEQKAAAATGDPDIATQLDAAPPAPADADATGTP